MAIKRLNNLSGTMNQHSAPNLLRDQDSELAINLSQDEDGAIATRAGSDRYLTQISGTTPVRGLHMFEKPDRTFYLHWVYGGNLYVDISGAWVAQASSEWSNTSEISMVNFIDRHYMASSAAGEYVRWFTETGSRTYVKVISTTVSSASTASTLVATTTIFSSGMVGMKVFNTTDASSAIITAYTDPNIVTLDTAIGDTWDGDNIEIRLEAKYLAVNGGYMLGVGGTTYPRRGYFTNLDSDKVSVATDYFIFSSLPTGVTAFGNGRPFVVFYENGYMTADPATLFTNEVEGFGCVSHKSIAVLNGNIMYLGRDAFYMLAPNTTHPEKMSLPISNDVTGDAIFNKIDTANFEVIGAVATEDRYYCALRSLTGTVKGQTLSYALVEFDYNQKNWKVDTFNAAQLAPFLTRYITGGKKVVIGGSLTSGTVHKLFQVGTFTDDQADGQIAAYTSLYRTKHFVLSSRTEGSFAMNEISTLEFKYYSSVPISVKVALDGSHSYATLSSLPAATTNRYEHASVLFGGNARTISIELSWTGEARIYEIQINHESLDIVDLKAL